MKEEGIIKIINKTADNKILFKVKNGCSKLREGRIKTENNFKKKVILLDDIPLITVSEENSPMCSIIIKMMKGREGVNKDIQEKININKPIKNIEEGFEKIKPVLKLLDDGNYELKGSEMIPTDGEDNYFWNSGMSGHYYNASVDIYCRGNYMEGFSKFLVPSEGIGCINMKRVEYYREKIRNGEELVGIALELRGFMALLLDGHHKATAAYLEGKNLKCLTIKYCDEESKTSNISKDEYEKYDFSNIKYNKINISEPKEVFPDFKAIAAVRRPIDISRKRIDNILKFQSRHPIEELKDILYYLTIYDKSRAKELCFEILSKMDFQIIWGTCLQYLSKYKDKNVKRLFSNMLLDSNIKYSMNYVNNVEIINKYFNKVMN